MKKRKKKKKDEVLHSSEKKFIYLAIGAVSISVIVLMIAACVKGFF